MTALKMNRRRLLAAASAGVGLAFAGRVAAQSNGPANKLVVVIARGAMDGLSVTVPHADPNYVPLRGGLAIAAPGEANLLLKGCTIAKRVSASRCSSSSPQGARREPPRAMQDRRPTAAAEQT